ncbi:MAG TPA: ABC transporter permease [Anaerolineaceae bacterium]|jgi:ABC-type polysaccharide/polyol phosphate export permease|nr:ABC transporter permease [Longilinea sp.]HNZ00725.1 ABC transporter permease [Anaerolineaceae bacterium]HOH19953.1 ABC transporter permease [Anaerolineaceae bacterium]HPA33024.1 ABC transporter permease [Anaerolineaceae bacterium]HQF46980.1 ABC transporter permease [Anaerolineaceae bacterium]
MADSDYLYDSARHANSFVTEFLALIHYRELVRQMISRSIKTRYKRSALGVIWTMLNPLLTMLVLTIVFSTLFRFQIEHYPVYILSGLLAWNFFASTTNLAMGEMLWSGDLLKRIYLPKAIFVVSTTGSGLVNMGLSMVPLLIIMLITRTPITSSMLILPVSILALTIFAMGVGFILSTIVVYFQDIMPIYEVVLMMGMYATPIIYPPEIIPERFQFITKLNPVYYFVRCFQEPIFKGQIPSLETWITTFLIAIFTLIVGWYIFTRKVSEYAYRA